jgi:hypothetical protein
MAHCGGAPAIVLTGSVTGVKEQLTGPYAAGLADAGYVTQHPVCLDTSNHTDLYEGVRDGGGRADRGLIPPAPAGQAVV